MFKFLIAPIVLLGVLTAHADTTSEFATGVSVQSEPLNGQTAVISLSYLKAVNDWFSGSTGESGKSVSAHKIKISLGMNNLTGQEQVGIVLLNFTQVYRQGQRLGSESVANYTIDLALNPTQRIFEGEFPSELGLSSVSGQGYESTSTRQEIAVVIDGNWLVDPKSKTHNFEIGM
jgi:hypothetical protein